jgi:2-hydroxy-3-keto-5-methylthiopentenyl-1-phosphate phosphatase
MPQPAASRLILCDFDGTVTSTDTLSYLSKRFSPEVWDAVENKLFSGEMPLRAVLEAEMGGIYLPHETVVQAAVEAIPLRPGFAEFVAMTRRRGDELVVLSAGFRQLIVPMMEHAGVRDVELIANDVKFSETDGGTVTWRSIAPCELCSETCKRADVDRLRAARAHGRETIFIGDGFSDRCGAEAADRVFARDNLAHYLTERGFAYTPFQDFVELRSALC